MASGLFSLFGAGQCPDTTFLGLVPWYHYINLNPNCEFDASHPFELLGSHSDLLLILVAIVDDLMRIIGLVAVIFVIYAGIKYMTSQGAPDQTAQAQSTLINALIGLAIALVAIPTISFIGFKLGGGSGQSTTVTGGAMLDLTPLPNPTGVGNGTIIQTVLQIVFGVLGALAFLFMIIGGFRYVVSQGDPQNIARAKNTIMYALIGLVVAIVAESIVSLIIGKLF